MSIAFNPTIPILLISPKNNRAIAQNTGCKTIHHDALQQTQERKKKNRKRERKRNTEMQKIYSFSLGLTLQKFVMVLHQVRILASHVCCNSFSTGHWNLLFTFLILCRFSFLCSKSTWFFLYGWFAALNSESPSLLLESDQYSYLFLSGSLTVFIFHI